MRERDMADSGEGVIQAQAAAGEPGLELREQALARIRDSGIMEALWPSNEGAMDRLREIMAQLDDTLIAEFFPPAEPGGNSLSALIARIGKDHGLTGAEQRVLLNLCLGVSLKDQAAEAGVSHNTVRSQTQHLLEKTGTHSQQEVISLVFRHLTSR